MTIDFSARLESGVNAVFPNVIKQKCVFHAVQLLTRGLRKELFRVKNKYLLNHIKEWASLSRLTIDIEKNSKERRDFKAIFSDVNDSWKIYKKLREIISDNDPQEIERNLVVFFSTPSFLKWAGKQVFLQKFKSIFTERKFKFSQKALKYVIPKIYKAWRAAVREIRKKIEDSKDRFNKIRYLLLMNPLNMSPYHVKKLRNCLKEFPWLRSYRRIIVSFYYQFRVVPEKRKSLAFLAKLISEDSHSWLKSAVKTLIENEENVFRFQHIPTLYPNLKNFKAVKVVNESSNKLVNQLYRVQCGMRTLQNLKMRISHRLQCPIIVSPTLLDKVN